jgi:hypothetical protein
MRKKHLICKQPQFILLKTRLRREHIDTMLLLGRDPNLPEIEHYIQDLIDLTFGNTASEKEARVKLNLRLGEVCYLQGESRTAGDGRTKRDDAHDAFERAVGLEAEVLGKESCTERRSLISGHGARSFLRAMLNWAIMDAKKGNWESADKCISRARDIHAVSLRRLSRHAADRAGILLDEARLHYAVGYVNQYRYDLEIQNSHNKAKDFIEIAHCSYGKARDLIETAHAFVIQPGLPIATKLDLDGLIGGVSIHLSSVYDRDKDNILKQCKPSIMRMKRIADRYELAIYKVYSRLLLFKLHEAQMGDSVYEETEIINCLEEARLICEAIGLGLHKEEIKGYLEKHFEPS